MASRLDQDPHNAQNHPKSPITTNSVQHPNNVVSAVSVNPLVHTTIVRLDEVSTITTFENDDIEGDTSSEAESQQQRDVRVPKRRLLEIEHENSPLQQKRQKIDHNENESMKANRSVSFQEPQDTIAVNTSFAYMSQATASTSVKQKKASNKNSKVSTAQSKAAAKTESNTSKHSTAQKSTPRRSSRQQPETPSSVTSAHTTESGFGRPMVVFGSTSQIPKDKTMLAVIGKLGGTVVTNIDNADVLCIGSGQLKKTGKFVIAVATGKDIVTDDWVKQAFSDQRFPGRKPFLPKDAQREKEWGFSLSEALKRGKHGLRLLENVNVYMTAQLRKDLGNLSKELKQIALCLGAASVSAGLPKKNSSRAVLVIGSTKNIDPEAAKVSRLGYKLYGQDLLTMAALRGQIEQDSSEFLIEIPVKDEPSSQ